MRLVANMLLNTHYQNVAYSRRNFLLILIQFQTIWAWHLK